MKQVLAVLLLCSGALNVALLLRPASATPASLLPVTPGAPVEVTSPGASRSDASTPAGSITAALAVGATGAPAAPRSSPTETARIALLEARVRSLQGELDRLLPPSELYARGEPSPDLRARAEGVVKRVLEAEPDVHRWDLDCHGSVCRLHALFAKDGKASVRLQVDNEVRALFSGRELRAAGPSDDPAHPDAFLMDLYLKAKEADATDGRDVLIGLLREVRRAGADDTCLRGAAKGALQLSLAIHPAGIEVHSGGALANSDAARCYEGRLRGEAERTPIPSKLVDASFFTAVP